LNYEFTNKNELITYYEGLDSIEKNAFINEIKNDIRNISIRFNVFKKMIFLLLNNDTDPQYVILKSGDFAEEALNLVAPYDSFTERPYFMTDEVINLIKSEYINIYEDEENYSANEIVDIANDLLELVYKTMYYFSTIYSVSYTFSEPSCMRSPDSNVPEYISHIYHSGVNDRRKLLNKYKRILLNIDKTFESEWDKNKKNFPCKLE